MTGNEHSLALATARKQIARELGVQVMRELHRSNRLLDGAAFVGVWATLLSLGHLLASEPFGLLWLACFVLQGAALQMLLFVAHDLFNHRRVGPSALRRGLGILCLSPLLLSPTATWTTHITHHRRAGLDGDSEEYKWDLDRRWVKLLFLCLVGIILTTNRRFKRGDGPRVAYMGRARHTDPRIVAKIKWEQRIVLAMLLAAVVAGFFWTDHVVFGYVLPLFIALPVMSTVRTILEHANVNRENPVHNSTFYRTGPLTRLLFLWDSGDCHLVHHLFPNIPYYRMGRALALMTPILERMGVAHSEGLPILLYRWFIENRPHGTYWAPAAGSVRALPRDA